MATTLPGSGTTATTSSEAPSTAALVEIGKAHLVGNYRQPPLVLHHGKGVEVWDTDGKRYLDLCAGVAVSSLGHAHPKLVKAISEQAAKLMHMSNYFFNEENLELASELTKTLGYDRAMFSNSGAEANEAMLKIARRFFWMKGDKERYRIVAFDNAFHGRTMGALAMTGTPKYKEGFGPPLEGFTHVPYGDVSAVKKAMGKDVAAIIVEPVEGEGGVVVPQKGFLKELRAIADENGSLLLLDEVQTGIARTGKWLGSNHEGVEGDAVALAKGLGGGFPIGCLLVKEKIAGALPPGSHGSTYGGNALASAAARAVLRTIKEEKLCEASEENGKYLGEKLASLAWKYPKVVKGERGLGLLRGLVLEDGVDARVVLGKIRDRGVLLTIAGERVLRFTPPLVIGKAHLDEALAIVESALAEV